MKSITINGSLRESVGKASSRTLRNAEKVPCVLYGGDKPIHFSATELAFTKLVYTPDVHTVAIDLDKDGIFNAILQEIQFHPVSDRILHADFYQIFDDKEITMGIPVKRIGNSRGVRNGGVLSVNYRKLRVRGLPAKLPDYLEADISKLKIGDKLYVSTLETDDFTILHPDNTVVCQVRTARTAIKGVDDEEDEDETEEGATAESAGEGEAVTADEK